MVAPVKGTILSIYLYLAHRIGCDDYVTTEMAARAIIRRIIHLCLWLGAGFEVHIGYLCMVSCTMQTNVLRSTTAKIVDRVLGETDNFSGSLWGYNGVCDRFRVCMESLMSFLGFPTVQVPDMHLIILATAYGIFFTVIEQ